MPLFYNILYLTLKLITWIIHPWGRWQVKGKENVPKEGPLLVVANHMNLTDSPLLTISLGRKAKFMAKEELFTFKVLGHIMYSLGFFPVRRGRANGQTIRKAQQWLAQGGALIAFPEGTRSRNAQLQSAFSGPALIALRSGAPILPVGISGTEKLKSVASALSRPRVTINIGHPFYPSPANTSNKKLAKEKRAALTKSIMWHIAELLPPEYRGNYTEEKDREHEN